MINHFTVDYIYSNQSLPINLNKSPSLIDSVHWKLPPEGYHKLNIDGSWFDTNKASGGGVLRKENGTWFVGYSTKYKASTPLAAELLATREGLSMARDFHISFLELETDVRSLKFMLDSGKTFPHHELSAVINDIAGMLSDPNWKVNVMHIPRASNTLAHVLAAFAHSMDVSHTTHFPFPIQAKEAYEKDLSRATATT